MVKLKKNGLWLSGILITLLLYAIGLLIESIIGSHLWFKPTWPQNLYFYSLAFVIGLGTGLLSDKQIIKQLGSKPSMLPSMLLLFIAGIVFMFCPSVQEILYFSYVSGVSLFFLLSYSVLSTGIFIAINLKSHSGIQKVVFLIPWIGYLLFILSTVNGQNDYYKMEMWIGKNRAIFEGQNYDGRFLRTPFALKLISFSLPNDEVELVLDNSSQSNDLNAKQSIVLEEGHVQKVGNVNVKIDKILPKAVKDGDGFVPGDSSSCVHAARIGVYNNEGVVLNEGWVCSGSKGQMPLSLDINSQLKVSLQYNEEQNCIAQVRLFETVSKYTDHTLSKTEKVSFIGWDISFEGFNPVYGESSPLVEMNLVFDRWYEFKFIGLAMLLIGLLVQLKKSGE